MLYTFLKLNFFITLQMILYKLTSFKPLLHSSLFFNHYQTLNVHPNATDEQIKASFISLAKRYHPDNTQSPDHKEFIQIKEAYDVLKEPNSRRLYDMQMFPQKIEKQTENFYFYRAAQFEQNHRRRKQQQKRKINMILNSLIFISITGYLYNTVDIKTLLKPTSFHDIRRQNIILANQNIDDGPAVQERRRQQYAQEMKDKKIYGSVIQLKVRGAGKETTKAKEKRLHGITSIQGVQKERILDLSTYEQRQEYM